MKVGFSVRIAWIRNLTYTDSRSHAEVKIMLTWL